MAFLSGSSLRNLLPTLYSSFVPDTLRLLNLCKVADDLKPLKSLLLVQGLFNHESLVAHFLTRCFDLGAHELALSTFQRIGKPSIFLQNLTVRSLCDNGLFEDVLSVYQKCRISGCPSDNFTFPFVVKACSALGTLRIGKAVHSVVLGTGFGDNVVVQTALVDMYAKCGQIEVARLLLDGIPQPDLVPWNALISGYSLNGPNEEVFEVFREIFAVGLRPNVSTLASTIPVCTRLGFLNVGKSLHGFAVRSGYSLDRTLIPALISMYAGGGELGDAKSLFDCFLEKNVTMCNAMISAYAQNQKSKEAFATFQQILQSGMQPNMITFLSLIPSCAGIDSILYGESLHACVVKNGLDEEPAITSALLSMYAKLGEMSSAEFLFNLMPDRNLLSWNSLLSALVHIRQWGVSLARFREMQFAGFNPDAVSIVCILSACSELEATLPGKSAHAYSIKNGFDLYLNLSNALLVFYSNCGKLFYSFNLFHKMNVRNATSWNTIISGCVHNGETTNVAALLHQMQQERMNLDLVTLISVLPCYNGPERLLEGMAIHGHAIRIGFACDVSLANVLISMYSNCGAIDSGKLLFERMLNRNVISWNALLTGYRHHNLQDDAMLLFCQMIDEDQKPNYVTLLNIIPVCHALSQGKSIHAYATRTGIGLGASLLTSLMSMYARFGNVDYCLLLFEIGEKRNISLWNAMISALVQTRNAKKAVAFFSQLLQMEIEPDFMTVLSLISACVQTNNLSLTNSVQAYAIHKGFDKDLAVNNALIHLHASCGNISTARKLFEGLLIKDPISWSVMINAHGLHGDAEAALALFSQMELSGVKPDDITYVSILSACSHAGLVEQGRMIFESMVEDGISPRMEHYACMVDLLGRTGHLNEACDIAKKLPPKPSMSLLESLAGACIVHGNFKLGEDIGRLLLEMDPEDPGSYVILHNVFASAGRWVDASKVRSSMEGRRLSKLPAFSLVEGL